MQERDRDATYHQQGNYNGQRAPYRTQNRPKGVGAALWFFIVRHQANLVAVMLGLERAIG